MNLLITRRDRLQESFSTVARIEEDSLPLTFGEMAQMYLRWKDVSANSEHTKRAYHFEINRLLEFIGKDAPAENLNRFSAQAFAVNLSNGNLAVRTRRHALSYVRDLVKWAHAAGIYAENFTLTLKLPRLPKTMPQVPTEAQLRAMLDGQPTTSWPARDLCIAEILYCNLRVFEVAAIDLGDINGEVLLVHGKGRRERQAFLTPTAKELLTKYLLTREARLQRCRIESNALFVNRRDCQRLSVRSIHRIIKAMAHSAGLPRYVSPVKLRAACATHMLNAGTRNRGAAMRAPFTIMLSDESWHSIRRGLECDPETIPVTMRAVAAKILAGGRVIAIEREVSGRFRPGELKVVDCDRTKVLCLFLAAVRGEGNVVVTLGCALKKSLPGLKVSETLGGFVIDLYGEKLELLTVPSLTAGEVN